MNSRANTISAITFAAGFRVREGANLVFASSGNAKIRIADNPNFDDESY